jgi:hypothetical protein
MYLLYEISQLTEGKCLRWASFLSRPQNTYNKKEHVTHKSDKIPDPDPNIFSSRILHEKCNANTHFFLAAYAFRSKVLVLLLVKKIQNPGSEIRK